MSFEPTLTDHDYELLSAYLDGMLTAAERAALEARLQTEPLLKRELAALRRTVALVKGLPVLKAPRNFILDASMVAAPVVQASRRDPRRDPRIILFPAFSALAAAAAVIMMVFGVSLLLSETSSQQDQTQVALFALHTPTPAQEATTMQAASGLTMEQTAQDAVGMQVESAEDEMEAAVQFAPPATMQESPPDSFTTGAAVPAAFPTPSPTPMTDAEFEALEEMLFNQALTGGNGMGGGAGTPGDTGRGMGGGAGGAPDVDPSSSMRTAMTPPGADEGEESPALVFGVAQAPEEDDITAQAAVEEASTDMQVVVQTEAESQKSPAPGRDTTRGVVMFGAGSLLLLGSVGLYLFYRRRVL